MTARRAARALVLLALGCGARPPPGAPASVTDEIRLYRDRALIEQRVALVAASAGRVTVALRVPAGVGPSDIIVLDHGDGERTVELERAPTASGSTTQLTLALDAPRAGRFVVSLGYATDQLRWAADYTLTTDPAHDQAVLRGAAAIRNTTGIALRAHTQIFDAELGAWRDHPTAQLTRALAGAATTAPRDLGIVALGPGETRVELLAGEPPRPLRSVLVYDPIGPGLDHPGAAPAADPELGASTHMTTRITESVELARDDRAHRGLPAGDVKLLERRADGSLAVLGASRLFDAATPGARADSIAIGTARGLLGHRVRRDWAKDDDQRRFSEEFLLTIDSARPRPVEVVIREHLYRGQNWTLAYQSAPAAKEGAQQIALRAAVPANGRAEVLYVVVYTW